MGIWSSKFDIHVTVGGATRAVEVCDNWTIQALYDKIAEISGIDVDNFYLVTDVIIDRESPVRNKNGNLSRKVTHISDYKLRDSTRVVLKYRVKPLPGYVEPTREPCSVTFDDDPTEIRAKMPCDHVISLEALEQLCSSTTGAGRPSIRCPLGPCGREWEFFVVRHVLSTSKTRQQIDAIEEQLTRAYMRQPQHDIRQCPSCGTYCTRDFSQTWYDNRYRVVCPICTRRNGRTFEFCWFCERPWIGGGGTGGRSCGNADCEGPDRLVRTLASCPTKTLCEVSGCPTIRACPRCACMIEHVDRCKHMRCACCETEFCFVCLRVKHPGKDWESTCHAAYGRCPLAPRQKRLPDPALPDAAPGDGPDETQDAAESNSSCVIL